MTAHTATLPSTAATAYRDAAASAAQPKPLAPNLRGCDDHGGAPSLPAASSVPQAAARSMLSSRATCVAMVALPARALPAAVVPLPTASVVFKAGSGCGLGGGCTVGVASWVALAVGVSDTLAVAVLARRLSDALALTEPLTDTSLEPLSVRDVDTVSLALCGGDADPPVDDGVVDAENDADALSRDAVPSGLSLNGRESDGVTLSAVAECVRTEGVAEGFDGDGDAVNRDREGDGDGRDAVTVPLRLRVWDAVGGSEAVAVRVLH